MIYQVRPLLSTFGTELPGQFGVFDSPRAGSDEALFRGGYLPCVHFARVMNKAAREYHETITQAINKEK